MNLDPQDLSLFYFQVVDLWQRFCHKHTELFDLTCEEYDVLLRSEIEVLNEVVAKKEEVVKDIRRLEDHRKDIIHEINVKAKQGSPLKNVSQLLTLMQSCPLEKDNQHLERYNLILIDIIEKIQSQNKRNQAFINKALKSLREMKEDIVGGRKYDTYNSKGVAVNR